MTNPILFVERNIHGAWVIYGLCAVRQYYGYTKTQAMRLYRQEYKEKYFENER